jgi:predicted metal-binding protein
MTQEIIGIAAIFAELKQGFVEWDAKLERLQKMLLAERLSLDPPARTERPN